ncbi:MAG TPA: SdrD B-like domain-containing protein, partial [Usitatibacter sp.]
ISPRWNLIASYYDNRSQTTPPFTTIAPVVPADVLLPEPHDRAIFVTLRYEDHAGTPTAPLGGAPGSGAGVVVGYIWYDANEDGRRSANETGAANVTVILDGKFSVRTNSDGKFEFPFVASGAHSITVIPDNLALPYAIAGDGHREVAVRTRETTSIDIPATRLK